MYFNSYLSYMHKYKRFNIIYAMLIFKKVIMRNKLLPDCHIFQESTLTEYIKICSHYFITSNAYLL